MIKKHRIIIIGSGPAGLSAALFAARAGLTPLVISGSILGGQLMRTNAVRNWPGVALVEGPTLMHDLQQHATQNGAHIISDTVTHVSLTGKNKLITVSDGTTFHADAIIIACGTTPRRLYCPGEDAYWQTGVYTKLPAELSVYTQKPVHIIGGGNSAIHFASRLLAHNVSVTLVQDGPQLTATDPLTQTIINHPRLQILYNHTVTQLTGTNDCLAAIILNTQENCFTQPTTAVFLALGNTPSTRLFQDQLELSNTGHISIQPGTTLTSIEGVFAAGDVADARYRHAITSAAQGCMAALDAELYLQGKVIIRF
jgi:thioredoxin reductase (NADPH)